jgi:hypothetical protein
MSNNPQQRQGHLRRVGNSNSLEWVSTVQDPQAQRVGNHALYIPNLSNSSNSQTQRPSARSSSNLQIPSHRRKGAPKPPRVQHDGNHIIHISKPSTSMLPPSASGSSNPHTSSHPKESQAAAALLARPVVVTQNQQHRSRKGTSKLGNSGSNDPSVPELVRNAVNSLLTDGHPESPPLANTARTTGQMRKRPRRSSGINANTELERLGLGSSFFETIGIPTTLPDPVFPPHTIPADKIREPPIIPKKPRLHERLGQLHRDVNFGNTWLYRTRDTAMGPSPHSTSSSGPTSDTLSAPLDTLLGTPLNTPLDTLLDNQARTDSPLPQVDSASWNPIATLEDEGLNHLFVDNALVSKLQPKSRGSTSRGSLAQRWNELIPHLIAPFMRRVAATNWDASHSFDAHLPACDGHTCSPRMLRVTCIYVKGES